MQQNQFPRPGQNNGNRRADAESLENYTFGKVQPHAIPLEEAVLGALMLDRDAVEVVQEILKPASFYVTAHQIIFSAINRLTEKSRPVDLLTVTDELRTSGELDAIGGGYYLVDLTSRIASAANIEYHARIIEQKYLLRAMISASTNTISEAYTEQTDALELLEKLETGLFDLRNQHMRAGTIGMPDLVCEVLKQAEIASKADGGIVGVPSGLDAIDKETGGFRDTDLIVIAARPGMGKSAAVSTIMANAAKAGYPVGLFSPEMSGTQVAQRIIAAESGITGSNITNGKIEETDWANLKKGAEAVSNLKLYINDTAAIPVSDLRAIARRWVSKHGVKLIVVDYLQLMTVSGSFRGTREQEISAIARGLKAIAKDLKVPVIALSQLSRGVESRGGDKRPMLSDLRESGAIEQEADMVAFLYSPEYYNITENEIGTIPEGHTEFIIAKHRNGRLCTAFIKFVGRLTKFENIDKMADGYKSIFGKSAPTQFPIQTPAPPISASARPGADEDIPF